MTTFGDRLRQVREAKGWSQEKLGFELDVSKANISKWELNKGEPRLRHLARLRQLFVGDHMTLDWLIDDAVAAKNMLLSWNHIKDGAAPAYELSPRLAESAEELALLVRYRRMSKRGRRAIVDLMETNAE